MEKTRNNIANKAKIRRKKVNFIYANNTCISKYFFNWLYTYIYAKNSDKKTKQAKNENDDELDAVDEVLAQEPKAADPFAAMPKG